MRRTPSTGVDSDLSSKGDTYRDDWFARWDAAEQHYFGTVMQSRAFDLVLQDR